MEHLVRDISLEDAVQLELYYWLQLLISCPTFEAQRPRAPNVFEAASFQTTQGRNGSGKCGRLFASPQSENLLGLCNVGAAGN